MQAALNETSTFCELQRAYEALLQEAQRELSGEACLAARRAIAASRLTVAQLYQQPIDVCHPLFEAVLEVGFVDAEDRLSQVGAYCRYCVRARQPHRVEEHLAAALDEARLVFSPSSLERMEVLLREIREPEPN